MFEAAERGPRVGKWIFGTCVKDRSRAFGPSLGYLRALFRDKILEGSEENLQTSE